ncbi:hypothetical protein TNCV_2618751 [Trichonephila clavipes]|nr:hypothetical protein TNCV_2618751 [Trichonephila clavipes]
MLNPGGILFHFREGPIRKCFPMSGICWQKFMARLQFVWVQLRFGRRILRTDDGGKPNRLAASRALLVPNCFGRNRFHFDTMQGARASFKHGRPARARSSNNVIFLIHKITYG